MKGTGNTEVKSIEIEHEDTVERINKDKSHILDKNKIDKQNWQD